MGILCNFMIILTYSSFIRLSYEGMTNMKVVDEPTHYGANLMGYQSVGSQHQTLKARVAPANFSGPSHLARLVGKCFSTTFGDYKYEFCPFANVTQHETVLRWNAYSGVLGVWHEWKIENNTFVSMMMRNGDACGQQYRSTEVELICGNRTAIVHVSEPRTCEYVLRLSSPLVCHPDSLLVYPTLDAQLQASWDELEGQRLQGFFTEKGYKKRLNELFITAGLRKDPTKPDAAPSQPSAAERKTKEANDFLTLYECRVEYTKLQQRISLLEDLLKQNGINVTATD